MPPATLTRPRGWNRRRNLPTHSQTISAPVAPNLPALGRAVRELRVARFISRAGLGARASLHRNYVGAIERGIINPTFRTLVQVANGLRLPLSELVVLCERNVGEPARELAVRRTSPV